jgi:hypothetical protein
MDDIYLVDLLSECTEEEILAWFEQNSQIIEPVGEYLTITTEDGDIVLL